MQTSVQELEAQVMSLGAKDRAHLLERRIDSFEADTAIQNAWVTETLRREREVNEGKVALVPGAEAISRIRQMLACVSTYIRTPKRSSLKSSLALRSTSKSAHCRCICHRARARRLTLGLASKAGHDYA